MRNFRKAQLEICKASDCLDADSFGFLSTRSMSDVLTVPTRPLQFELFEYKLVLLQKHVLLI